MAWIRYEPGDYRLDDGRSLYRVVRIDATEWQGQARSIAGWTRITTSRTKRDAVKACEADRRTPRPTSNGA